MVASSRKLPELNTWVMLARERRGKRARAQAATATPALVSAVQAEAGTATVIYPCELVLMHGFKGSGFKRITAVPFSRLKPASGSAKLHELLMTAVRAEAASLSRAMKSEDTTGEIGNKGDPQESRHEVPEDAKLPDKLLDIESSCTEMAQEVHAEDAKFTGKSFGIESSQGCKQQSWDAAPSTPHKGCNARDRSRSRSEGKRRSHRLQKAKPASATRELTSVVARAFAGKGQITIAALLSVLEDDATLQDARSQKSWDAMGAIRHLEEAQKVFIADELVFSLA